MSEVDKCRDCRQNKRTIGTSRLCRACLTAREVAGQQRRDRFKKREVAKQSSDSHTANPARLAEVVSRSDEWSQPSGPASIAPPVSASNIPSEGEELAARAAAVLGMDREVAIGFNIHLLHVPTVGSAIERLHWLLSMVEAMKPANPMEAMLASQIVGLHCALMDGYRRLGTSPTPERHDADVRNIERLSRSSATLFDTLKRMRTTGEQRILVQHVTVEGGGQAIVGNVQTGGGAPLSQERQPHELGGGDASGTALLSEVEAVGLALPMPSSKGLEGVPDTRREVRRT